MFFKIKIFFSNLYLLKNKYIIKNSIKTFYNKIYYIYFNIILSKVKI